MHRMRFLASHTQPASVRLRQENTVTTMTVNQRTRSILLLIYYSVFGNPFYSFLDSVQNADLESLCSFCAENRNPTIAFKKNVDFHILYQNAAYGKNYLERRVERVLTAYGRQPRYVSLVLRE